MAERTLFVVDDHPMVVRSIGAVAAAIPGVAVIGSAGSGEEALRLLAQIPAPDLLLVDVVLPGLDGMETAARYRHLVRPGPDHRVVLMSTASLADLPGDLAASGADGFVPKDELSVEFLAELLGR